MPRFLAAAAALVAPIAFAHPGHAAASVSHWHASDVFGFVVLGVVGTAFVWITRGRK